MGFRNGKSSGDEGQYRDKVLDAVRGFFPPELIGRLDDMIVFNHLTEAAREEIFDREVRKLEGRLSHVRISISESARSILLEEAKDDQAGARAVQRVFRKRVEEPCAGLRISGLKEGAPAEIVMDVDAEGGFVYEVQDMTDGEEGQSECRTDTKGT